MNLFVKLSDGSYGYVPESNGLTYVRVDDTLSPLYLYEQEVYKKSNIEKNTNENNNNRKSVK